MMDLLKMRRSVRKYKDKNIDPRTIDDLKEAALRAPSSRGINPWRFVFITDREILTRLSRAKEHGSDFIEGARLGVVICADEMESDVWVEDCSIASIILQLAGLSLGLGSCWIQIRNRSYSHDRSSEDYVREVLGLPQGLKVESMIALGYPDEEPEPVPRDLLEYGKILQK